MAFDQDQSRNCLKPVSMLVNNKGKTFSFRVSLVHIGNCLILEIEVAVVMSNLPLWMHNRNYCSAEIVLVLAEFGFAWFCKASLKSRGFNFF